MPADHETDWPVPLDDLQRASTEQLLDRHVSVPLRHITTELATEVAERVTAALAELDELTNLHHPWKLRHVWATKRPMCAVCSTWEEPGRRDEYAEALLVLWPCDTYQTLARIRATLTGEDTTDG